MREKSKTGAVLLAVFLSYWTWVYTYQEDSWKFWLGLAGSFFGIFLLFVPTLAIYIWAIIDTATKTDEWYKKYYKTHRR